MNAEMHRAVVTQARDPIAALRRARARECEMVARLVFLTYTFPYALIHSIQLRVQRKKSVPCCRTEGRAVGKPCASSRRGRNTACVRCPLCACDRGRDSARLRNVRDRWVCFVLIAHSYVTIAAYNIMYRTVVAWHPRGARIIAPHPPAFRVL